MGILDRATRPQTAKPSGGQGYSNDIQSKFDKLNSMLKKSYEVNS